MTTNTDAALVWLVQFLLIMTRMTAMFVLSPILGRTNLPNMAKIGLSLLTAFLLINFPPPVVEGYPFDTPVALAGAVLLELLVGFVLGFGTILFFMTLQTAGHIIDMQIGFAMANQFDPGTGMQMPIAGSLLNLMFIQCFLLADGIPILVAVMRRTFEVIPVGGAVIAPEIAGAALQLFVSTFVLAIRISMPVIASALLCEIALGIIVRTAPQMNVFVIGIPIRVAVGLVSLLVCIPAFVALTDGFFDRMYEAIDLLFAHLAPG
ncbi:MAG: flagellar biosynthetic protein FliR [Oscillospiraceae bacterium]|nr:flagellar biosynthetic protein FliR [Oscillospiraceae bacterium]